MLYFSYRGNASGSEQGRRLSLNSSLVLASFSIKKGEDRKTIPILAHNTRSVLWGSCDPILRDSRFSFRVILKR